MSARPWDADHDLSEDDVRELLAKLAPELAGAPLRALGEGWDYRAVLAGGRVLRVAKRADVGERIASEAAVLLLVAERLPLEVPRLLAHAGLPQAPHGLTLHDLLPGRPLREVRPSPRQLTWIATRLGAFIGALHAIDRDVALAIGVPEAGRESTPAGVARRARARLQELRPLLAPAVLDATERLLASPPAAGAGSVLVHADLWPEHLLVDEASHELTGVIDWADAEVGDPAEDFAAAWFLAGDEGLAACLRAAGEPPSPALAERARFFGVHHAIGDAWYAAERDEREHMDWALAALQRLA